MSAVREGLADVRDRISDMEALPDWDKLTMPEWDKLSMPRLDKLAENTQDLIDRATGRQRRRPAWPIVALGVVAVIGIAVGVTMFMMNRSSMQELTDDLESDIDSPWTPSGSTGAAAGTAIGTTTRGQHHPDDTAGSFPASDPMPSPMSPSLGS
jgi:hypothetical protein